MKELNTIQCGLKANKDLFNQFGGYGYRSTETILEALKPLLQETKCVVTLCDEVVMIGQRYYVKSTATIRNEQGEQMSVSAFAREEETKRGMDSAMITGSASSYARKYALCGLFAIDDGRKDPDAQTVDDSKQKAEFAAVKKRVDGCRNKDQLQKLVAGLPAHYHTAELVNYVNQKYNALP